MLSYYEIYFLSRVQKNTSTSFFIFLLGNLWPFHDILGSHTAETPRVLSTTSHQLVPVVSGSSRYIRGQFPIQMTRSRQRRAGRGQQVRVGAGLQGYCRCSFESNGQPLRENDAAHSSPGIHVQLRLAMILIIQSTGPHPVLEAVTKQTLNTGPSQKAKVNTNIQVCLFEGWWESSAIFLPHPYPQTSLLIAWSSPICLQGPSDICPLLSAAHPSGYLKSPAPVSRIIWNYLALAVHHLNFQDVT